MTVFTLRWGILATGGIAKQFVGDLVLDPATRDVHDVAHEVVAVGSSSSLERAQQFITEHGIEAKAYATYEGLVHDPDVDIVYIASPASHHYNNTLLALEAGKHVCCEKPFTINAAQTEHVIRVARSKGLFLMEAVWTRFFPAVAPLLKILHSTNDADRIIGKPLRLLADFSLQLKQHPGRGRWEDRNFDPTLGGGALLDLGIYCVTWASLVFFQDPRNEGQMPKVTAAITKTKGEEGKEGWKGPVDNFTSIVLEFEKLGAVAILRTSLAVRTPGDGAVIQGEKGNITLPLVICRPEIYKIDAHGVSPSTHHFEVPKGHGLHYEADACARAIRDGKLEAEECSLDLSLAVMKIMDEVRKQGGLRYPDNIEALQM